MIIMSTVQRRIQKVSGPDVRFLLPDLLGFEDRSQNGEATVNNQLFKQERLQTWGFSVTEALGHQRELYCQ